MKALRTGLAALLIMSLSSSAFADSIAESASRAAEAAAAAEPGSGSRSGGMKPLTMAGAAVFVTGFTFGVYSFINNKNGTYSEFGEAGARNVRAGAIGLSTAFGGGVLMLIGSHMKSAPNVQVGRGSFNVSKQVTW